jgi:hypothetical protein
MPDLNQSVTDPQNPGTPVPQGTPGASGVASTVTTGQGVGDAQGATLEAQLQEMQTKLAALELDRRRQQATLQSQADRTAQALKAERDQYKARLEQFAKSKMDEKELTAYERETLALENQQLKAQLQEQQAVLEQRQQMQGYIAAFKEYGIPEDQLDTSSPEALANSGWAAMGSLIKELRAKHEGSPQLPAKPNAQQPHQPYTGQNTTPQTGQTTFADVKAAIAAKFGRAVSDAEVWDLAEQGRISLAGVTL